MIHCDAGPRVVRAYPVEKSGAGYKATIDECPDQPRGWYRPATFASLPMDRFTSPIGTMRA